MVKIGEKVPDLKVSEWVGTPTKISEQKGKAVLVAVFQVNCPLAVAHLIPGAIVAYNKFSRNNLTVLGLATSFEDFDKNTPKNLRRLIEKGETIGDTYSYMSTHDMLSNGLFKQKIEFPVAIDSVIKPIELTNKMIIDAINSCGLRENYTESDIANDKQIFDAVKSLLQDKGYPESFYGIGFQGTPSYMLLDKQGFLRYKEFSSGEDIDEKIKELLKE
ncbi:MAG: redoxin domain-containing protein [Candidatus Micrarchaeota archaeon]|nr:redoxin domain-containing protein [Candidatus Micrarchaeota archaeon]MDE1847791.1 redoxin domain-containing protein [Candidatus Micrarchaeota archaeon]MDE1864229.1 redoxin domain-containing protein [Candidatus Micrarchaeota archaeon]